MNIEQYNNYYKNHIDGTLSQEETEQCVNCKGMQFIEDNVNGIVICTNPKCGIVYDKIIDITPEWRLYEDSDKGCLSRCNININPLLPQTSLNIRLMVRGCSYRIHRYQIWNLIPYKERSLNNDFKKIHDVCQKEGLQKCIEDDAKIMFKILSNSKHKFGINKGKYIITRGTNKINLLSACLYFACVKQQLPRTCQEIGKMWETSDLDVIKGCKKYLELMKISNTKPPMFIIQPEHFIKRYCSELGFVDKYISQTIEISNNLEKFNLLTNHAPYAVAFGCILLMLEYNNFKTHIDKKFLSSKFDISEFILSKVYKDVIKYKLILLCKNDSNEMKSHLEKYMKKIHSNKLLLERMKMFNIQENEVKPFSYYTKNLLT